MLSLLRLSLRNSCLFERMITYWGAVISTKTNANTNVGLGGS
jgi:hypothetical protein